MADTRRPAPGDPLTFPAAFRARTLDAIECVERLRRSESPDLLRLARDRGLVKVKNNSGAARSRFDILGVNDISTIIRPENNLKAWKNYPVLSGVTPATPTHCGQFVVLQQPLKDDAIGWGLASGVTPVQVSFTYSDEPYADIATGTEANLLGGEGGAQVLWKATGTGTQWALVRVGVPYYPILRGKLDGDLNSGSSATMSVWEGATLADSGRNETVYDSMAFITAAYKVASGTPITASWHSGKWHLLTIKGCEVAQ